MSSHLPPTQSVWAINDTVNNTVTISRGLLEAATSDNVNPVAILSCEAFGNVLPLCVETRYKIERLARRNYTSHVLNFIKAQIGYRKGDVVELLSNSDAGVRFLCLAATFCSMDHYEAARRIDSLLQATQSKDQLRPTIRQLQVMMGILMSKLVLSDFAHSVAGWEIWYRGVLQTHPRMHVIYSIATSSKVPPKAALEQLILELSGNHRLGEEKTIEVRSRSRFVPWTIAFVKWFLGAPPLVRLATGLILLEQDSPILLTILPPSMYDSDPRTNQKKMEQEFSAMSLKPVKGLRQIIFDGRREEIRWRGAMDVRAWMQYRIGLLYDRFIILRGNKKLLAAIGQALYFIVKHVPMRLLLWPEHFLKGIHDNSPLKDISQRFLSIGPRFRQSAFPTAESRLRIAQEILGDQLSLVHREIDKDKTLHPESLAEILKVDCRYCRHCSYEDPYVLEESCLVNELLEEIGNIGAALLVFSLFGSDLETFPLIAGGPRFDRARSHRHFDNLNLPQYAITSKSWPSLIVTGWQALMYGSCKVLGCDAWALFRHSAELLGHGKIRRNTVISSKFGQVIYPIFFEATEFMRKDYLHFSVFPGILRLDNMEFESLLDRTVGKELSEVGSGILDKMDSDDESAGMSDKDSIHEGNIIVESVQEAVEENAEIVGEVDAQWNQNIKTSPQSVNDDSSLSVPIDYFSPRLPSSQIKHMQWDVSIADNILWGQLNLSGESSYEYSPAWPLLSSLSVSILSAACVHQSNSAAGIIGQSFHSSGIQPSTIYLAKKLRALVPVGRVFERQLHALEKDHYRFRNSSNYLIVIHNEGCLECALKLCIEVQGRVVIS